MEPRSASGFLAAAYRPLFLAAGFWAVVVIIRLYWGEPQFPLSEAFGSVSGWHAHEMAFGFAGAAFAGYTLTAAPSWSGRRPVSGTPLFLLVSFWIMARLVFAGQLPLPVPLLSVAGAGFFGWLSLLLAREALIGRSRKGLALSAFAAILFSCDIAVVGAQVDTHLPILVFAMIMSQIGGRIVSGFTANRLPVSRKNPPRVIFHASTLAAVAIFTSIILTLSGAKHFAAFALIAAALAELVRLAHWLGRGTVEDGLLFMLHSGYSWLPAGLLLTGLGGLDVIGLSQSDALHALSAGAISCLVYAVAARSVARRTPLWLVAGPLSFSGYVVVWLSAAFRLFQGMAPGFGEVAALLWVAGWLAFLVTLLPHLRGVLPRPVFSGPKSHCISPTQEHLSIADGLIVKRSRADDGQT